MCDGDNALILLMLSEASPVRTITSSFNKYYNNCMNDVTCTVLISTAATGSSSYFISEMGS